MRIESMKADAGSNASLSWTACSDLPLVLFLLPILKRNELGRGSGGKRLMLPRATSGGSGKQGFHSPGGERLTFLCWPKEK